MSENIYVGLMSGTSLDGISAAVVSFRAEQGVIPSEARSAQSRNLHFTPVLLAFHVHEYSAEQRERLLAAMRGGTAKEYCMLAADFGNWLADAAIAVMAEAGISRSDIRAIGTHGQTLWHEPPHSTWQIDAPAVIAERTGVSVVSDFRVRDVAAGGQGAPLVPIADALLFGGGKWRALQNIGGIGNVTIVPPDGTLASVRAFDTGPGAAVIDAVMRKLYGQRYDKDGLIAASGTPNAMVLEQLMRDPYFSAPPPKSTGRELFDERYVDQLVFLCRATETTTDADIVATATALTARSIADAYRLFIPEPIEEALVSGGGAKNPTLMRLLRELVAPLPMVAFEERYFDGEAKEAVAFALLAHLHLERIPGNVPTATGAKGPRILGMLTPA